MLMNSQDYWQLFLDTGSPELYLLYNNARKLENGYVYDDSRPGLAGHSLQ